MSYYIYKKNIVGFLMEVKSWKSDIISGSNGISKDKRLITNSKYKYSTLGTLIKNCTKGRLRIFCKLAIKEY